MIFHKRQDQTLANTTTMVYVRAVGSLDTPAKGFSIMLGLRDDMVPITVQNWPYPKIKVGRFMKKILVPTQSQSNVSVEI